MPFIRSISGLRATLGDGLLPSVIASYAVAFAKTVNQGQIVIGRDGRPSGKWIEDIVAGALIASGCEVRLIGVVPTPTVQLEVEFSDASGGIAITASHNPGEWNGMKFINKNGVFLDEIENAKLWEIVDSGNNELPKDTFFHEEVNDTEALHRHINRIHNLKSIKQNFNTIKAKKYKVVVDAVNSSGSHVVPELLRSFGCEVIDLFCDGSGLFPHTPEPLPQNLYDLAETVKAVKADIGVAVDPDADRLVLIDEHGNPIGEEKTIAIAVESVICTATHLGSIVVNLSTSAMSDLVASKYGFSTHLAPVGEINVVKKMKETGALIGGEGSGGVILPECHYGRDSLVGIALTLNLMALTNKTLSELADDLPKLNMVKLKKEFTGNLSNLIGEISKKYQDCKITLLDGIRVDFEDGKWFQLRTSNTEPIVRAIAEASDFDEATKLANEILELVK
jgi:phosphomannomutase